MALATTLHIYNRFLILDIYHIDNLMIEEGNEKKKVFIIKFISFKILKTMHVFILHLYNILENKP